MAGIVPGPAMAAYYPDDVLNRQYRLADQLRNVPQARSMAGVFAQGLGALGGNLVQGSADNAIRSNQAMRAQDIQSAAGASDLPSLSKALLGSQVPELQSMGLKTKIGSIEDSQKIALADAAKRREYESRAAVAEQYGMAKGSPEWRQFVLTGDIKDPLDAEFKRAQIEAYRSKATPAPEIKEFYDDQGRKIKAEWNGQKWVPLFGAASAADDSTYAREQTKYDVKSVGDYREKAGDAEGVVSDLDALKAARAQTTMEGPVLNWLPNVSAASQAVNSAATRVQLGFTSKTKGAISDKEMAVFEKATPGMAMSDEAATPVIDGMRLAARRVQEKHAFFDSWLRSNKNLDGAQQAWQRFITDKPILQETSAGGYTLRPENVSAWQGYLKGNQDRSPQPNEAGQKTYDEEKTLNGKTYVRIGNDWYEK